MSEIKAASRAEIRTAKAQGYLVQLCKHFAHKIPATYADNHGRIAFDIGVAELDATDPGVLKIEVSTQDPDRLAALQDVADRHLKRFAFKEELEIAWVAA